MQKSLQKSQSFFRHSEAEFKEFEPRLKFETQLKHLVKSTLNCIKHSIRTGFRRFNDAVLNSLNSASVNIELNS